MSDPDQTDTSQLLVYATEDGQVKIDVRLENETVWLTQQQMAALFQTTQQNISLHLQNIFDEGELQRDATHKESLSVRQEGNGRAAATVQEFLIVRSEGLRNYSHVVDHFNHDAIIFLNTQARTLEQTIACNVAEILEA